MSHCLISALRERLDSTGVILRERLDGMRATAVVRLQHDTDLKKLPRVRFADMFHW
jgi:hypothetical protein